MRWLVISLALTACSGSPCVDASASCDPLYEPTFDNLYERTFKPACGIAGGCHSGDSPAAGMNFDEIETAYGEITARIDGEELGCHTLITKIYADDPIDAMPPGAPLDAPERCGITQWVQAGAPR